MSGLRSKTPLRLTGLSRPTLTAWVASTVSDAASGSSVNVISLNDAATNIGLASASSTRWGASAGAGFEWLLTPNWSVGLDYNHLFMGSANDTFAVASPVFGGALNRIDQEVDVVTIRVNYKFGWSGAPVATPY